MQHASSASYRSLIGFVHVAQVSPSKPLPLEPTPEYNTCDLVAGQPLNLNYLKKKCHV